MCITFKNDFTLCEMLRFCYLFLTNGRFFCHLSVLHQRGYYHIHYYVCIYVGIVHIVKEKLVGKRQEAAEGKVRQSHMFWQWSLPKGGGQKGKNERGRSRTTRSSWCTCVQLSASASTAENPCKTANQLKVMALCLGCN